MPVCLCMIMNVFVYMFVCLFFVWIKHVFSLALVPKKHSCHLSSDNAAYDDNTDIYITPHAVVPP